MTTVLACTACPDTWSRLHQREGLTSTPVTPLDVQRFPAYVLVQEISDEECRRMFISKSDWARLSLTRWEGIPSTRNSVCKGIRAMLFGLAILAATFSCGLDAPSCFSRIDGEMSSRRLGTAPAKPFGELVEDGEGQCERLPFSTCSYREGAYIFYFREGRLVSKQFVFSRSTPNGPFGLNRRHSATDVVTKLSPYVGGKNATRIDGAIFYELQCPPMKCRLDIEMNVTGIESIRLYYSDAV